MSQIFNYNSNSLLSGTGGNDYISNDGSNVTIDSRAGNDYISNWKGDVTINSGSGNDSIFNHVIGDGGNVKIDAGEGDDSIDNGSKYTSIVGGAGNDSVLNGFGSDYSTINTGAGDDFISLISDYFGHDANSVGNVIIYKLGDGNDKIYEFDDDDTLSISGGSYSSVQNGSDIIVTVGDGKISLMGAASLDKVNIEGTKADSKLITLTEGNDNYNNSVKGATINALGGKDTIYNNESDVSISGGAGNDYLVNGGTGNGFTLQGSNFDSVTLDGGAGDDTIWNDIGGKNPAGQKVSISGGNGNDWIGNDGAYSTLNGGAGNDSINNCGRNVLINGGAGNDSITNTLWYDGEATNVTINGGTGNDYISNNNSQNKAQGQNVLFKYNLGDGNDTIVGFNSTSTLSIAGGTYSSTKSGNNIIVTVGDGKITLVEAASTAVYIDGVGEEENTWTYNNGTAKYGTSDKTLVTVKGVKSIDGLSLNDKVVTVSNSSLNAKKVTISGDEYTLALADDVNSPTTKKAAWSYDSDTGTATYKSSYKTAGYKLASNAKFISYSKATNATTLATVTGVKSKNGLSVSGKVITVAESSVNKKKITLTSDEYTLALADGLAPTTKKAAWSYDSDTGTATYKSSYKTAGYKLASNAKFISYSKATNATTLATITGARAKPTISNNIIKLKPSTINSKVTLSGNYEFDFSSGNYKKAKILGSSSADKITSHGKNISLNGGAGNDTIKIYGSATSIKGGNGADVFIFDGGSGVITDYASEDKILISGAANVTTSGDNVIFNENITIKGGKDKVITYFDADGEHIYPNANDEKIITLTDDYDEEIYTMGSKLRTLDASAVPLDLKIVGNKLMNSIIGGDGNDTLIGGGSNDTLTGGKGSDIFVWNKGDGNDIITDYAEEDTIEIVGSKIKTVKPSTNKDDIIFTLTNNGKITVVNGADKVITYSINGVEKTHSEFVTYNKKGTLAKLKEDYPHDTFEPSNYSKYADDIVTIDASEIQHEMFILGNDVANSIIGTGQADIIDGGKGNDTIRGGAGNDSLFGGKGNDSLYGGVGSDTLWGGAGDDYLDGGEGYDLFVYSGGMDTISGYEQSVDKIMIISGNQPVLSGTPLENSVTFSVDGGKFVVTNSNNTTIEFIDSKGNDLKPYVPEK